MAALFIPKLNRGHDQIKQLKRNKNKEKRIRHQLQYNKIRNPTPKPINIVKTFDRISRERHKTKCRERIKSLPERGRKTKQEDVERVHTLTEHGTNEKYWIHEFTGMARNVPITNIKIDGKNVTCTVDTGATRIMITSAMATEIWGKKFQQKLRKFPDRNVEDAQGNPVTVLGFKQCKIDLGEHLSVDYPAVVYKADHQEILLGYTFLVDHNLNIYCGKGIGTKPQVEIIKRLNYAEEQLQCTPLKDEIIPPKAMKAIKVKVWFPSQWNDNDKMITIGSPIVTHSEDIGEDDITQLKCPYTYDILGLDFTANVLIDNTNNLEPLLIDKAEIIAHAEFVHDEASPEQVKRIIQDSSYSINEETQLGEYKLHEEDTPKRYDYVDAINIKSEEEGTAEYCRNLLMETESFWSKSTFDMGKFDKKARMTLTTTTPIWDKYRPINPNKEKQAQEIINQLEKYDIISRANSPYCSQPVWCWKKPKDKEGKLAVAGEADLQAPRALRLALDYRRVNKIIASQCHFPNPSIKEILFKLKSAKYVSIMDLTNSYWHIELTDSTKPILAFQTSTAQYVWNRLPQGTAPSMSIMAEAVQDTIYTGGIADCCTCYVDNIIVSSNSREQHKKDLRRTIEAFTQRGWKANPGKSHVFINTACRLFGFHIDLQSQTIGPDPQKAQAIMDLPPPTNQKSARSLCGSINYYSDLIPDLAPLMGPLHEITKDGSFEWTKECQENFEKIKKKLADLPVIHMPDFNQSMHLFTDAAQGQYSGYHISQYKQAIQKFVPIAWGSHKFSKNEQSMSQPEAELFAIIHAVTQESLLLGFSKVIVHTDCKSLTYLFRFSKICSKLTRWQLILSSYDLDIYFEPSDSIGIKLSDMLSRRPGKRITNRKPKIQEIEQLPNVKLTQKSNLTLKEAQQEILKQLAYLPPIVPETIKYIQEKFTPQAIIPEDLECNKRILNRVATAATVIDDPAAYNYKHKYVYTPDQIAYKNDISPSGRLINFVLQEAPGLSLTALRHHQLQDPYFGPTMKEMMTINKPVKDYAMKDGILLKETNDPINNITYVICVPRSLSLQLIGTFHHSVFGAHPDLKKLMSNLKRRFFIKNLKNECLEITKKCQICTLNKSWNVVKQPYGSKIKVTGPRQIYAMDICTVDTKAKDVDTTLPTSFLIITDVWCLYSIAVPINADATSREILEKFSKHIIQPYGIPKIGITTDGAKNFSNRLSNTFSAMLNLQQFRISPYNARANPAERINRAILAGLRYASQQFHLQPEVFKNLLNYIVLAWNTSVLSHLNFSPYQLFLSTPYEPAALTSFITIQEADKDYGDFIAGLVKTQHIVENLVNKKYKETRDKRYQKKLEHSKHSIYAPGTQIMIRQKEDNTKRVHKLRPRFTGPYKIIREFENNVEVIPWMANRNVKFIHKYKNEARMIPKFEKYLISKDRIKPCDNLTFFYDEALARRFYQEFWDMIRDVQPIAEVERAITPTDHVNKQPKNRPSSLILPAQIGVQQIPPPHQPQECTERQKIISRENRSHRSSHQSSMSTKTKTNDNDTEPTLAQTLDTDYESAIDTDDDESQPDNHDIGDHAPEPILDQARIPMPQNPSNIAPNQEPPRGSMPMGRHHLTNLPRPISPFRRGTTSPYGTRNHPSRPPVLEEWVPARMVNLPLIGPVIYAPNLDERQLVERRDVRSPPQGRGARHLMQRSPGPSNAQPRINPEPIRGAAGIPPQPIRGAATLPPHGSTGSIRTTRSSTSRRRMDPAVKEALTSNSALFQDPEFQGLKDFHARPYPDMDQEIQNVSDVLEQDFQSLEQNIDAILLDEEQ